MSNIAWQLQVDGREHPVKQVKHVLDPARPEFNPRAAKAMTGEHARVECYTCHASWNANFLWKSAWTFGLPSFSRSFETTCT